MNLIKENIRSFFLNKRMTINHKLKENMEKKIFQLFIKSPLILFNTYHLFLPIKKKMNLIRIY